VPARPLPAAGQATDMTNSENAVAGPTVVRGVWCATLTPLDRSGAVDHARLADHALRLLDEGVDGIAPFGTTGEGPSFGVDERRAGLEALVDAGIAPARILAATACAALPETVALTRHAVALGCAGALVLPPFFWKDVSDEGVYANYAALIEEVADPRLRLYLYNLPQVSAVPVRAPVIEQLLGAFPGVVVGLKDSAGDLEASRAMLARFPGLAVYVGHEPHLPAMLAAGGAGTVCGVANLLPRVMRTLYDRAGTEEGDAALACVRRFLDAAFAYPLTPAFKALVARLQRDDAWAAVRAPLRPLPAAQCDALVSRLADSGIILQ
jgi:4-hydroxy-tetrahydrodipicolinate synthase